MRQVLESIHKFIIELRVLQCLFVKWSNKNKGGVRLFQISQKERLFCVLYQPSDNLAMWFPFLHPSKKVLSFPFSLGKRRVYLKTQLKGEFTDLFGKKVFPLTLLGHSFKRRAYWLLFHFESYQDITYSYTGKEDKGWWTLC